jgi:hypothetical protein
MNGVLTKKTLGAFAVATRDISQSEHLGSSRIGGARGHHSAA